MKSPKLNIFLSLCLLWNALAKNRPRYHPLPTMCVQYVKCQFRMEFYCALSSKSWINSDWISASTFSDQIFETAAIQKIKRIAKKFQKDLNNNLPHLGYSLNSIGSKATSQQTSVHWLREITKAKLSKAKTFVITSFYSNNEKRE